MKIFSFDIFGVTIAPTWYGLMYALGFFFGYLIIRKRKAFSSRELDSLLLWIFIAVIVGGRLGYVLFYNLEYFLAHPGDIFKTWEGGMSFHGATIAVIIAIFFWSWRYRRNPFQVGDEVCAILPLGIGLGRIGNYINGELYGFANYTGPFPIVHAGIAYFPTPLLEGALEGAVLMIFLYFIYRRQKNIFGMTSAYFLLGYGVIRFSTEFVRLPDPQVGYLFGTSWMTLGQLLSVPMIVGGLFILTWIGKKEEKV